ncbi:MAG: 4Fe-4S binding protein [Promethearchaeota archaeon]
MTEADYYEIIRQKLVLGPLYAPKHKKVVEFLKIFWNEEVKSDEMMYVKEDFCIGCGVCAVNCPNNAIKLVKVKDSIPKKKYSICKRTFLELIL